jgi:hypothetical protein
MAKAITPTLLSLEQYAEIIGANPYHFQAVTCLAHPYRTDVQDFVFKYAWQDYEHAGWEEIALAIASAEAKIASFIGFWPAPKYIEQETQEFPKFNPAGIEMESVSFNAYHTLTRYATVHCEWKKFIKGGRRRLDLIEDSIPIVYTDEDGDGFSETATITLSGLTTTGWLPKEIAVYPTDNTDPTERIRGLKVTIATGTVTIVGNATIFVNPNLWEAMREGVAINGDDASVYLTEVCVYREYCSDLGTAYAPTLFLTQSTTATPLTAFSSSYGLLQPYNKERSIVSLIRVTWDATAGAWIYDTCPCSTVAPNLVQMYYQAGVDTDAQGRMQPLLARAVASLATALMTKPVISQGPPENLLQYWQATTPTGTFGLMACPWGSRNGAWEAYSMVRDLFSEGIGTASV